MSNIWLDNTVTALGDIDGEGTVDYTKKLSKYLMFDSVSRYINLNTLMAVALKATNNRIYIFYLPRAVTIGPTKYLIGLKDKCLATRNIILMPIEPHLGDFYAIVTKDSNKVPHGKFTIKE